jgi:hypothetical protein
MYGWPVRPSQVVILKQASGGPIAVTPTCGIRPQTLNTAGSVFSERYDGREREKSERELEHALLSSSKNKQHQEKKVSE